jgi:hypothetical protein
MSERPRAFAVFFPWAFLVASAALVLVFHGGASTNPVSRALTVLAVVEDGSLRADRWLDLTIDRAIVDGHVYSDKPPLSSFVVVPFYAAWRAVHRGPYVSGDVDVVVVLGDVVAAAIPFGAFVLLLRSRASVAATPREAVVVALLAAFGTPLQSYGGTYFGHALAGTLFVFAYHLAAGSGSGRDPVRQAVQAGLLAGLAGMTDLTMVVGIAVLGVHLATRPKGARLAAAYVAGGLPCAVAFGIYNARITGSPFEGAYAHVTSTFYNPAPLRVDAHTLAVLRDLLFSEYRGLFVYAPALLVMVPLAYVHSPRRWLWVGFTGAHLVLVASYWVWDGGWCIGPRHLTPVLMVLLYEGVSAVAGSAMRWRAAFAALASLGVAGNLVAVATNPRVEGVRHPFRDLYGPAFVRGEMTPDSVFHDLGLGWGRGTAYAWCALFALTASLLTYGAEREKV